MGCMATKRTKATTFRNRKPITQPSEIEPNPAPKAPAPAAELDLQVILAAIEAGKCPPEVLVDLRNACLRRIATLTALAGELHRAGQPAPAKPPLPMDGPPPGKHPPQQQRGEAMRAAPEIAGKTPARRAPSADAQVAAVKAAAAKFATGGTSNSKPARGYREQAIIDDVVTKFARFGAGVAEAITEAANEHAALSGANGTRLSLERYLTAAAERWLSAQDQARQAQADAVAGIAEMARHVANHKKQSRGTDSGSLTPGSSKW